MPACSMPVRIARSPPRIMMDVPSYFQRRPKVLHVLRDQGRELEVSPGLRGRNYLSNLVRDLIAPMDHPEANVLDYLTPFVDRLEILFHQVRESDHFRLFRFEL